MLVSQKTNVLGAGASTRNAGRPHVNVSMRSKCAIESRGAPQAVGISWKHWVEGYVSGAANAVVSLDNTFLLDVDFSSGFG